MKVDFSNTAIAFQDKSNQELQQAHFLFRTLSSPRLVNVGKNVTEFALKMRIPVKGIIKATVYKQFVGGETIEECRPVVLRMSGQGVKSILDYSVEGKESEKEFDQTTAVTIQTIMEAAVNPGIPFAVFKPTGLCRFDILEKKNAGKSLSKAEEKLWQNARDRFFKIAEAAAKHNVPVMVDAEESWIQTTVDQIVEELMETFNKEKALIFQTIQFYRWDRLDYLKELYKRAEEKDYQVGLKIVRGAYMEKENDRAEEMGYKSPIQSNKESSDRDYDLGLRFIMNHLDRIFLVAGTHNNESSMLLVDLMTEKNIDHNHPKVWFAQLFGMSDNISFNLAHQGYNVVKYLPFGPVRDVMPYLFRRAEENTSVAGQTGRELMLIEEELKRRKAN